MLCDVLYPCTSPLLSFFIPLLFLLLLSTSSSSTSSFHLSSSLPLSFSSPPPLLSPPFFFSSSSIFSSFTHSHTIHLGKPDPRHLPMALSGGEGVVLNYTQGDICDSTKGRRIQTTLLLVCNRNKPVVRESVGDQPLNLQYYIYFPFSSFPRCFSAFPPSLSPLFSLLSLSPMHRGRQS